MTRPVKPVEPEHVSCKVCLKEVPKSEAEIAEAQDYVLHFCGLECYDQWAHAEKARAAADAEPASGEKTKGGG